MRRIYFFAGLSFLFILCAGFPAYRAGAAEAGRDGTVDFSIRFYDKRIYFAERDPVYVQITIANNSPEAYRFKLAEERVFSVDFDIRTMSNRSLEPAEALVRKRTQSQRIFFREIAVESGESFSFVEDLRDYVNLRQPGSFIVRARIYPELYRSSGENFSVPVSPYAVSVPNQSPAVLESNRLSLNIKPPAIPGPDGIPLAMDVETNAILVREKLPPDQVVEYLLTARQKSQWEKFFLYLDLEAMLSRDAVRRRQWLAEGEEGRRRMLERYRTELQSTIIDGDISTIPAEFTMERTAYNNSEGTVTVLEKFKTGNYTERKRYTYYLQRKDDIWTIVDYSVVNLGTE
ncbi:MAG: hypothetical protein LBJ90_07945 [Treponema sp.]|jgi:hypothetical protein|nr:hypothetical protein [Treponema sp.]